MSLMTSSFNPAGFQPPQQTSYGEQFAQSAQNYLTSFQIPFAAQQRNEEVAAQNAKQFASMFDEQTLSSLSQFSKSLNAMMGDRAKKKVEGQMAEGKAMVLDGRINADDLKAYQQQVDQLRKQQDNLDKTAAKAQANGAPFEAVNPIRKLSGWQQYAAVSTLTKQLSEGYAPWLDEQFQTNTTDAFDLPDGSKMTPAQARVKGTPAQQRVIRAFLRNKYLQDTGLIGVSDMVLASHGVDSFVEAEAKASRVASRDFSINESAKSLELANNEFYTFKDPNRYLNSVMGLVTENGPITRAEALNNLQKLMAEGLKPGSDIDGNPTKPKLTSDDFQRIKRFPIEGDPSNQTWGERLGQRFDAVASEVASAKRQAHDERERDRQRRADQWQQDVIAKIGTNGSEADFDAAIRKFNDSPEFNGIDPRALQFERANNSVEAKNLTNMKKELTRMADSGLLTSEVLSKYPLAIREEFRRSAVEGDAYVTPEYKQWDKTLENLVRVESRPLPDGTISPSATFMIPLLQQRFRARVKQLKAINNKNAEQQAFSEIRTEFQTGRADKSSIYYKDATGFPNVFQNSGTTTKGAKAANAELRKLDAWISGGKAGLALYPFYTKEQREQLDLRYGQPGWSPDDKATYIASRLNVNPLTVINIQRRRLGLTELGLPPSLLKVSTKVRPDLQKFLNRYQGPERTTRALNSMGWEPDIVPLKLGPTIERAAKKHGIEPALLAGLLEKESSWRQDIVSGRTPSSAGALGIAQFMPATAREQGVDPLNVDSAIEGAARYLGSLRKQYGSVNRALAHYAGYGGDADDPGFKRDYLNPVLSKAAKFGYGAAWRDPGLMRGSMGQRVPFITGNTGTSTGPHVDARIFNRATNKYEDPSGVVDRYLSINGKPISQAAPQTSGYGNRVHPVRGGLHFHAGLDFGAPAGTRVDVRGRFLGTSWDPGGGGYVSRYLIDGNREIVLMHGSQQNAN